MWPQRAKAATLHTRTIAGGYEQRSSYAQPDLLHESVLEMDSPFAPIAAEKAKLITYLLIGDQNAGN